MADEEVEVTFRVPLEVVRAVHNANALEALRSLYALWAGDLDLTVSCIQGRAMLAVLDAELPEPIEIEQGDEVHIVGSPWASVPVRWVEDEEIVVVLPIGGLEIFPMSDATLVARDGVPVQGGAA